MFRKELEFEKRDYLKTGERAKERSSLIRRCFVSTNKFSDSNSIVTREKKISANEELKSGNYDHDTNCSDAAHVEAGDGAELKINTFPHAQSIQRVLEHNYLKGANYLSPQHVEEEAKSPKEWIESSPLMKPTRLMKQKLDLNVLTRKSRRAPLNVIDEIPTAKQSDDSVPAMGDRPSSLIDIVRSPKSPSGERRHDHDRNGVSKDRSKFKTM